MATILVVDDQATNRELLATLLAHKGHRVIESADGEEALEAVRSEGPDLIIADVLMPVMDGFEFVRRLRDDPARCGAKVIFYTAAYDEDQACALALGAGVVEVIRKGSEPEDVLQAVESALSTPAPSARQIGLNADFQTEHLRLLTDKLSRKVSELEAANTELDAFAYSVSHDLRAPLRGVAGLSNILLEDYLPALPPEVQRHLKLISQCVQRMQRMIDSLLDLSRLSRSGLNAQKVDAGQLVREWIQETEAERAGRQIDLVVHKLPVCHADPVLLKQVFSNLLANALKFTRHSQSARIEIGCQSRGGEHVFVVSDNGAGFDMRQADKLFRPFQRLHSEKEYEGTGVGLAIVQRIIHRHGGRVWAEAEPGKGATFYFTLGPRATVN